MIFVCLSACTLVGINLSWLGLESEPLAGSRRLALCPEVPHLCGPSRPYQCLIVSVVTSVFCGFPDRETKGELSVCVAKTPPEPLEERELGFLALCLQSLHEICEG